MATFNKFQQFVEDLAVQVHDLNGDAISLYLSNTAPDAAADAVKADLAEISTGNGYTGPIDISADVTAAQIGGTMTMAFGGTDPVVTASGAVGPFRYVVLFNDTPASPADPLIGWWDYGSSISLANGETFTIDLGASILTIA